MRHRGAERRKDAVAGRLRDVAIVAMHRVDHQPQGPIDNRPRLFEVEVFHQEHGALMSANSAVTVLRSPSMTLEFCEAQRGTWP
jgi:hypothetical protein